MSSPVSGFVGGLSAAAVWVLVAPLRLYRRFVSPYLPPVCRFHPSCSAYAIEALQVHGPVLGSWLTVRRLLRCAPWHPGGYDPVPARGRPVADTTAEENVPC